MKDKTHIFAPPCNIIVRPKVDSPTEMDFSKNLAKLVKNSDCRLYHDTIQNLKHVFLLMCLRFHNFVRQFASLTVNVKNR